MMKLAKQVFKLAEERRHVGNVCR